MSFAFSGNIESWNNVLRKSKRPHYRGLLAGLVISLSLSKNPFRVEFRGNHIALGELAKFD